jgi:hypothetical protein
MVLLILFLAVEHALIKEDGVLAIAVEPVLKDILLTNEISIRRLLK